MGNQGFPHALAVIRWPPWRRTCSLAVALIALAALAMLGAPADAQRGPAKHQARSERCTSCVRVWKIKYRAHNGARRVAYVSLPRRYGPRYHPRIPLVISPHGRGVTARVNLRMWGNLPALGSFAVVNPQGQGRRLKLFSWGWRGQIADLARMPSIVSHALPWLRVDRRGVFAMGTSMGGQETLLLLARYPRLLAGAAAFDSVTDMRQRYGAFKRLRCNARCRRAWVHPIGHGIQKLARYEIGGTPWQRPLAYKLRSPITYARRIAHSGVPLELWWSRSDRVVSNQNYQSGQLLRRILSFNRRAAVEGFVGLWWHSSEMHSLLVPALVDLGLLSPRYQESLTGVTRIASGWWPSPPVSSREPGP